LQTNDLIDIATDPPANRLLESNHTQIRAGLGHESNNFPNIDLVKIDSVPLGHVSVEAQPSQVTADLLNLQQDTNLDVLSFKQSTQTGGVLEK